MTRHETTVDRPWPNNTELALGLAQMGCGPGVVNSSVALGHRSIRISHAKPNETKSLVLLRQRTADLRHNLSLDEEEAVLSFLWRSAPASAVKSVGFMSLQGGGEKFLVTDFLEGPTLAEILPPKEHPDEVLSILESSLATIHRAGLMPQRPALNRVNSVERILGRMQYSPLGDIAQWSDVKARLEASLFRTREFTILHGDPHAFNLICPFTREAGKGTWLDFEFSSLGPPEMDLAKSLLQTSLQAERAVAPPGRRTSSEWALVLFVCGEWMAEPPRDARPTAHSVVRQIAKDASCALNKLQ
jgi:aminoglycoside phosphotransferase (APT) family kinase protein